MTLTDPPAGTAGVSMLHAQDREIPVVLGRLRCCCSWSQTTEGHGASGAGAADTAGVNAAAVPAAVGGAVGRVRPGMTSRKGPWSGASWAL